LTLILVYWINYRILNFMSHKFDLNEKISCTYIGRFCLRYIKPLGYIGIIFASIIPFVPGFREFAIIQGLLSRLSYAIYNIIIFSTIRVVVIMYGDIDRIIWLSEPIKLFFNS
jgi:hypothetical protein